MIKIVYEDDDIIIASKPSGMPTHMLTEDEKGTVVNFLIEHCPSISGVGTGILMSGLVHRLDTDTSGLVLAAKDNESFLNLRRQFKEHKVLKEYIALVHGRYNGPRVISNFIGPDPKSKKKVKVYSEKKKGTRPAVTEIIFKKIVTARLCHCEPRRGEALDSVASLTISDGIASASPRNDSRDYSLLHLRIKTGVRHQIRSHLASFGNPIVGDLLYQNLKTKKKNQLGLKHHFLHAYRLGFYHPKTNKWMEFTNPLPEDLDGAMSNL